MTSLNSVVTGVDFITVWTKDFAAAETFYGTTLGLPCIERYGRVPGAEFETGNLTLQVLDAAAIGREFQRHPPIALHVDDVDAARAELESRGVEFIHAFDSGVCHNAFFEDPDGNVLLLHHRYAPKQRSDGGG
jgi:catechol 2,3-dioxygenase-like lactoylglutathione lyase family enzyme